jgi:hypothetical protein
VSRSPAPDNVKAPYAQAAAAVSSDGKLLLAKGIDSVTMPDPGAGVYWVKLADTALTVDKIVVIATPNAYQLFPSIATTPHPNCGNDPNSERLTMVDQNGAFKPGGFSIAVH